MRKGVLLRAVVCTLEQQSARVHVAHLKVNTNRGDGVCRKLYNFLLKAVFCFHMRIKFGVVKMQKGLACVKRAPLVFWFYNFLN